MEIEAGKREKQEGDRQIGNTVIIGDSGGGVKKKGRETTNGKKKSKYGREEELFA